MGEDELRPAEGSASNAASSDATPRVEVIIVNYNGYADTLTCVESILAQHYDHAQMVVVDNGSQREELAQLQSRLGLTTRVLATGHNLGFAGACNVGIADAFGRGTDFVLLLNNDAVLAPSALHAMLTTARAGRIGAVGARLYYAHRPDTILCVGGGRVNLWLGRTRSVGYRRRDRGQFDQVTSLDWVSGAAMLLSAPALREVGPFDERFFFAFEDVDLCIRLRSAGWEVRVAPGAWGWHKVGASSAPVFRVEHFLRGYLAIMKKHARPWHWVTFLPFFILARIPIEASRTILRNPVATTRAILAAVTKR